MPGLERLAATLRARLGDAKVIDDRQRLRTYECDGLAHYKVVPGLVVLPETTAEVAAVVGECAAAGVPFVARGSGTGLSGGALPHAEGVLVVTSRMRRILAVDRDSQRAVVEPGVINLQVTKAAAPHGYSGVRVANVFHAGDGNLHPLVLFDDAVPGEGDAAEEVSGAILDLCLAHGGSITGEHGVGSDKAKHMPRMFSADDLDTMQLLRCAFDPDGLSNPGKVFPTPRLCGEVPGRRRDPHPLVAAGLADQF